MATTGQATIAGTTANVLTTIATRIATKNADVPRLEYFIYGSLALQACVIGATVVFLIRSYSSSGKAAEEAGKAAEYIMSASKASTSVEIPMEVICCMAARFGISFEDVRKVYDRPDHVYNALLTDAFKKHSEFINKWTGRKDSKINFIVNGHKGREFFNTSISPSPAKASNKRTH